MNNQPTRRRFLKQSGQVVAATSTIATLGGVHTWAAEVPETVRLGIVGCGGIMTHHLRGLTERRERVSVGWLCDVDPAQMERIASSLDGLQSKPPRRTLKYEDVVTDADVDAIIIATPHHWHAPIALYGHAGRQGCLHRKADLARLRRRANDHRCRQEVRSRRAARQPDAEQSGHREGRTVATRGRSSAKSRSPGLDGRNSGGARNRYPIATAPAGVDYDRWLGPAPNMRSTRNDFTAVGGLFRDYGNGEIGDDGIHDLDMACWGLGVDTLARADHGSRAGGCRCTDTPASIRTT